MLICGFIVATTLFIESISLSAISLQLQPYTLKHKFVGSFPCCCTLWAKKYKFFLPSPLPHFIYLKYKFTLRCPCHCALCA